MNRLFFFFMLLFPPFILTAQETCDQPGLLFGDTAHLQFRRLAENSPGSDFSVTAFREGFVFVSSRPGQFAVQYTSDDSLTPLLDLYYFAKKDSMSFTTPRPFAASVNSKYSEGPACFSANGDEMIFTRSGADGDQSIRLYASRRRRGKWQKPVALAFCKPGFNYMHPALASNDSVLFFASDQPGGSGGMDLYYSRLTANGWSAPVNLGPSVNTAAQEAFPFCSAYGNLYFSSNRAGGGGKLDVYVLHLPDSSRRKPARLGMPVNSEADDFGFWCSADESEGFVSSNRDSAPTDDNIFYFRVNLPQATVQDTMKAPVLCYTFFEAATAQTLDTAGMTYEWSFSDGTKFRGAEAGKCFDTTGDYHIDLNIVDAASGEVFTTQISYDLTIAPPNRLPLLLPDTFYTHRPLQVNTAGCKAEGCTVTALLVDFGEGYRAPGGTASHTYHRNGVYFPSVLFRLENPGAGTKEYWQVTKRIVIVDL